MYQVRQRDGLRIAPRALENPLVVVASDMAKTAVVKRIASSEMCVDFGAPAGVGVPDFVGMVVVLAADAAAAVRALLVVDGGGCKRGRWRYSAVEVPRQNPIHQPRSSGCCLQCGYPG